MKLSQTPEWIALQRLNKAAPDLLKQLKDLCDRVEKAGWNPSEIAVARAAIAEAEPACTPPKISPVISAAGSVPRQLRSAVKM